MRATVLRRVGNHSAITNATANSILQDIAREIGVNYYWSERKREVLIQTTAPYSTGTVAVTQGSSQVLGTGTAWTAAMVGRAIRITGELSYFFVQGITGTTLTLGDAQGTITPWAQSTASGQAYTIFQHQYQIASNIAVLLSKIRDWPLDEKSLDWIDARDPQRLSLGTPFAFALARANITGATPAEQRFLELWPVPSDAFTYRQMGLIEPPDLVNDGDLPVCPSEPVEWRASAEASWYLFSKTGDPRWNGLGQSYYKVYAGDPTTGELGVLDQALRDDANRFGLPQTLGDGGPGEISQNDLAQRDWSL